MQIIEKIIILIMIRRRRRSYWALIQLSIGLLETDRIDPH